MSPRWAHPDVEPSPAPAGAVSASMIVVVALVLSAVATGEGALLAGGIGGLLIPWYAWLTVNAVRTDRRDRAAWDRDIRESAIRLRNEGR